MNEKLNIYLEYEYFFANKLEIVDVTVWIKRTNLL